MRTLLYLSHRELVNYLRLSLRTPKRLIPLMLFVLYLVMMLPMLFMTHFHGNHGIQLVLEGYEQQDVWSIAFVVFSLALVYFLHKSLSDSLLIFSLPEIDFVFSTPVDRRTIVLSKLLKLYARIGVFFLIYMLFILPSGDMLTRPYAASYLAAFVTMVLFAALIINVSTLLNLITTFRAGGNWWLAWAVKGLAVALFAFAVISCASNYRETGNILGSVESAFRSPFLLIILFPAKWAADLVLSPVYGWQHMFGTELSLLFICVLASLGAVLLRDENPYEPSLSISEKAAARRLAFKAGGFGSLMTEAMKSRGRSLNVKRGIPPFGTGAWAVVWKNMNIGLRTWSKSYVAGFVCMLLGLIAFKVFSGRGLDPVILTTAGVSVVMYLMMFMQWCMLGVFSADLRQANVLRPMPVKNWKLIAATAVQGPVIIVLVVWPLAILLSALSRASVGIWALLVCISLPFAAYSICCSQSVVAAIYPNREDQFQQSVGLMLSGFMSCLSVLPACITGFAAWMISGSIIITSAAIIIPSVFTAAAAILLGDYAYRRYDPTDE